MICLSLADITFTQCLEALETISLAEIRMDRLNFSQPEFDSIYQSKKALIAACRPDGTAEAKRINKLSRAVDCGAAWLDIEIETPPESRQQLIKKAKERGSRIILSYHNYRQTPPMDKLLDICQQCYDYGADMAKIACLANSRTDCARILSLYDRNNPIVAFALGEIGQFTRFVSLMLGAPFTYASLSQGLETGPGQIDLKTLTKILDLFGLTK